MLIRLSRLPAAVLADGRALPLAPRDAALLAWLALDGPTPRNRLAALLWPHSSDEAARNSLRQRLFHLRKQLAADLVSGSATLALADGLQHDLDADSELLEDSANDIGGEFDAWLARHRDQRRQQRQQALVQQADAAAAAGDVSGALQLATELLTIEPLSEAAHRRLMQLHYLAGDRAAALQAFDRCERALRAELDLAPAAETLALRHTIAQARGGSVLPGQRAVPVAVLRPPRLIGRDAEARALDRGWRAGQIVVVTGEAGMGKTRLLQDFAQPRPGVVHVSARPGDSGVPLSTVARLLRAVAAAQPPAASHDMTTALDAVSMPGDSSPALHVPGSAAVQRLQLQRDVATRLRRQRAVSGLLLDDLHFADAASLDLLQALLDDASEDAGGDTNADPAAEPGAARPRAGAGLGLHWALAWRAAEVGSPLQALHDTLAEQARLSGVALQPLDEAALAELVDSLALPGLDGATLAPALRRRTGGNPLFVLETLKLVWVEQRSGEARTTALTLLPRPTSVTRLIERRLAQLSPAAMALARCAAVAGAEFSGALAARVLGTSPLALADAWQELEAAQVLRDEAFVHDLLYEATLASVPAPIARVLHAEIAAQLQAEGHTPPATLARHWLAAGQPGQARPQLEQAALAATQALDAREAGRLWLQLADVHEAAAAQPAAFEAAKRAVHALRELTTGTELEAAIQRTATLARKPAEQAEVQRFRVELHLTRGETAEATVAVQAALTALGPGGAPTDRSDLLNLQGVLYRRVGRMQDARQSLEEALALARAHAKPGDDYAGVLNNLGLVLQSQDEHLQAIGLLQESAERQHVPATRARVLNNLAISLEERGQVELAHQQRLAAARAVAGSGSVVERVLAISLGSSARHLCRYREALQHFEHARSVGSGQKHFRHENLLRHIAALWVDLGRINLAQQTLLEAQQQALSTADLALLNVVRAQALVAQGPKQAQAALALLQPAEAFLLHAGDRRTLRRLWLVQAAALPAEEAVPLLQAHLNDTAQPGVAVNPGAALPLQVRLAQALLAMGETAAAHRAAERAADWLAAVQPMEMTPAEVWLTLARCAHAAGDAPVARSACQRGLDFVNGVAREQLDAVYREGWLQRNPVNAALAALAAVLTRLTTPTTPSTAAMATTPATPPIQLT